MVWNVNDPQGNEAGKVKYDIVRYTRGVVMDVGCGPHKAFPHFIGVDNLKDVELFGIQMTPDLPVADATKLSDSVHAESLDAIFSSHMLEHVEDYEACLADWWGCIKPGGYLILYLPHKDLYPNVGTPGANPDHKHDFDRGDIKAAMCSIIMDTDTGFDLLVDELRDGGTEYSFLQVYRKNANTITAFGGPPRPRKSAIVIRHGGIGDQMQAAFLLPELKRQGFHITMLTTPRGREPIEHDPNIDGWYMVDVDQVPNHELGAFWKNLEKHYDRVINLNESVEGLFLALPGRIQHQWPQALRHARMNGNYAEHAAMLAGIEFKPEGQFYETADEAADSERMIELWGKLLDAQFPPAPPPNRAQRRAGVVVVPPMPTNQRPYVVVFALAGSSPHKVNPWQDQIIRAIRLQCRRAVIALVGDEACKILEQGFEGYPGVHPLSGMLSVRATLSLARHANLVIGPETGVLNAVAYESTIKKVVLLSHSSPENLTKHWLNTTAVEGVAPCYPCHQLHYTAEFCPRDEQSATAICQRGMDPIDIYGPIQADYAQWARLQLLRIGMGSPDRPAGELILPANEAHAVSS